MQRLEAYFTKEWGLTLAEVQLLVSFFDYAPLPAGEFFVREGVVNRRTGFLLSGLIRSYDASASGADPTCYFFYPTHYLIDPYAYEEQKPSCINMAAVTDCELATLSFEGEQRLKQVFPQWVSLIKDTLIRIMLELSDQKSMLALNAEERYQFFLERYPQVAREAPLKYVASFLGLAQPSLSRVRRNLAQSKGD